jgi:hypothetical protein
MDGIFSDLLISIGYLLIFRILEDFLLPRCKYLEIYVVENEVGYEKPITL